MLVYLVWKIMEQKVFGNVERREAGLLGSITEQFMAAAAQGDD